jgi:hypothetical protein
LITFAILSQRDVARKELDYLMPSRWLRSFSFSRQTYSISSTPG